MDYINGNEILNFNKMLNLNKILNFNKIYEFEIKPARLYMSLSEWVSVV